MHSRHCLCYHINEPVKVFIYSSKKVWLGHVKNKSYLTKKRENEEKHKLNVIQRIFNLVKITNTHDKIFATNT